MLGRLPILLIALVLWLLPSSASADAPPAAEGPVETTVGIYLNQMPVMSLRDNKFTVDFYVWFRWKGDSKPYNTFDVVGGKVESKQQTSLETVNGVNYACYRVTATVTNFWDVKDFPRDNHVVRIQLEDGDSDSSHLRYIPDTQNSAVSEALVAPGWSVQYKKAAAVATEFTYTTNYGDLSRPSGSPSTYSRFEFRLPLEREGVSHLFKLFFALYLAVAISMLSLFVRLTDIGPRFGLATSGLFASVGASYVISTNLPPSSSFTRAEMVNLISIAFLFFTLIASVVSIHHFRMTGDEKRSKVWDRKCLYGLASSYVLLNVIALFWR